MPIVAIFPITLTVLMVGLIMVFDVWSDDWLIKLGKYLVGTGIVLAMWIGFAAMQPTNPSVVKTCEIVSIEDSQFVMNDDGVLINITKRTGKIFKPTDKIDIVRYGCKGGIWFMAPDDYVVAGTHK